MLLLFVAVLSFCLRGIYIEDVPILHFEAGKLTESRRDDSAIEQLICDYGCEHAPGQPIRATCENVGKEGTDVLWDCGAVLPDDVSFAETTVSCEGWSGAGDPLVVPGSCALFYGLVRTQDDTEDSEGQQWIDTPILAGAYEAPQQAFTTVNVEVTLSDPVDENLLHDPINDPTPSDPVGSESSPRSLREEPVDHQAEESSSSITDGDNVPTPPPTPLLPLFQFGDSSPYRDVLGGLFEVSAKDYNYYNDLFWGILFLLCIIFSISLWSIFTSPCPLPERNSTRRGSSTTLTQGQRKTGATLRRAPPHRSSYSCSRNDDSIGFSSSSDDKKGSSSSSSGGSISLGQLSLFRRFGRSSQITNTSSSSSSSSSRSGGHSLKTSRAKTTSRGSSSGSGGRGSGGGSGSGCGWSWKSSRASTRSRGSGSGKSSTKSSRASTRTR